MLAAKLGWQGKSRGDSRNREGISRTEDRSRSAHMLVTWPLLLQLSPPQVHGSVEGFHDSRDVPEGSRVAFSSRSADVCAKLSVPALH